MNRDILSGSYTLAYLYWQSSAQDMDRAQWQRRTHGIDTSYHDGWGIEPNTVINPSSSTFTLANVGVCFCDFVVVERIGFSHELPPGVHDSPSLPLPCSSVIHSFTYLLFLSHTLDHSHQFNTPNPTIHLLQLLSDQLEQEEKHTRSVLHFVNEVLTKKERQTDQYDNSGQHLSSPPSLVLLLHSSLFFTPSSLLVPLLHSRLS